MFTAEIREGNTPDLEQYVRTYPQHSDELPDLLSSIAMIEGLKNYSPNSAVPDQRFTEIDVPDFLGEYRIVSEIGRGGMGIVFEAVHETLGRRVAIKVMTVSTIGNTKHLERFHREAVSAASLHHTNIASVFGAGEDNGLHFYVMEFIDGKSLSQVLKGNTEIRNDTISFHGTTPASETKPVPTEAVDRSEDVLTAGKQEIRRKDRYKWVADTGEQIADALVYAHEKNILHRDIKPSNLVLDNSGTVWLTDFGLAKNIANDSLTKTGDIIGTPQYMAPESFSGTYDTRSETYCLGLTLYELSTLRPAFEQSSPGQVIKAVTTTSPPLPKKIDPRMPRDLATIIAKSISREPQHRYQTAEELRDDLRAFSEDRPISARTMTVWDQAVQFSRRNPLAAALSAFLFVALSLLAVTAATGYMITRSALERAESNVDIAFEAFDQTFQQYIAHDGDAGTDTDEVRREDVYGFQQISGIESTITKEDAQFVEKMLGYYQRLAIDNEHSREVRTQSATASRLVANVYRLIGQRDRALESYREAVQEFDLLLQERRDSISAVLPLVATRNEMASLLSLTGNWREGLKLTFASKEDLERHPHFRHPDKNSELRLLWVRTINQLTSFQTKIFSLQPSKHGVKSAADDSGFDLAKAQLDGEFVPAPLTRMMAQIEELCQEAIAEIDQLKAADPNNQRVAVARAESYCNLALHQSRANDSRSSKTLKVAIAELESLRVESPDNPQYQYLLALTKAIASKDQSQTRAFASLKSAKTLIEDLASRFPKMLTYRQLFGSICIELGGLQIERDNLIDARDNLELASELLLQLRSELPEDWSEQINGLQLVKNLETLAGQNAASGDVADAIEIGLQINRISEELGLQK